MHKRRLPLNLQFLKLRREASGALLLFCGFRKAQPEQRHVVRALHAYRTQLRTVQTHHAERSSEAAKQNRLLTDSARTPQSSPLRGRLGVWGNRHPHVFGSFDTKRTTRFGCALRKPQNSSGVREKYSCEKAEKQGVFYNALAGLVNA